MGAVDLLNSLSGPEAALIASGLATAGWLYTARRARTLSRKQHTINVILQASFNKDFNDALIKVVPLIKNNNVKDLTDEQVEREAFRQVANHYEFLAAGLRNGDFDERLLRDCLRSQLVEFFNKSSDFIWKQRDSHRRQTIYEHLEWLFLRWEKKRPRLPQQIFEWFLNRPLQGSRKRT